MNNQNQNFEMKRAKNKIKHKWAKINFFKNFFI